MAERMSLQRRLAYTRMLDKCNTPAGVRLPAEATRNFSRCHVQPPFQLNILTKEPAQLKRLRPDSLQQQVTGVLVWAMLPTGVRPGQQSAVSQPRHDQQIVGCSLRRPHSGPGFDSAAQHESTYSLHRYQGFLFIDGIQSDSSPRPQKVSAQGAFTANLRSTPGFYRTVSSSMVFSCLKKFNDMVPCFESKLL